MEIGKNKSYMIKTTVSELKVKVSQIFDRLRFSNATNARTMMFTLMDIPKRDEFFGEE